MNGEGYKDPTTDTAIANASKVKNKPWRHVTEKERMKIKKEKCVHCEYSSRMSRDTDYKLVTCDYIGIVGHSRG